MSAEKLLSSLKKQSFKPIYWLEGEESFFIDEVMHYAEHKILSDSEAEFNKTIFYGKDAVWSDVVNACKRYPMFATKQVVLLKEAQQMKDVEKLESYIANPLDSTILVVSYKDKKVDARTKFAKTLKANAEVLTTKKLYDNQLPGFVKQMVETKGLAIAPKALQILVEHIGNDLNRINNEIDKLSVNLGGTRIITEDAIETFVGISKDYNVFELQDAISKRNLAKAISIVQYFGANPKAAPIQVILPTLYGHFSKVYSLLNMPNRTVDAVKPLFYFRQETAEAAINAVNSYGYEGLQKILLLLHQYNLKSIGINSINTSDESLLKEMLVKIMS